tara:strand:- start:2652 stop:3071 length:420 start_codon:yes stop_codon:yes gene_type:complete
MIDLTETNRIKKAIESDPTNYQDIIEQTPLAICITNETGLFHFVNNNYTRLYGYSKDELIGASFQIVVPNAQKEYLQEVHDTFMTLKNELLQHWTVQRKNGYTFNISVDAEYLIDLDGGAKKITFVWPEAPEMQALIAQ